MCAQRRLRSVWSVSSVSTWRKLGSLVIHWAHSEVSDQTGRMPRLIWVFAGRTVILLVLSWGKIQLTPVPGYTDTDSGELCHHFCLDSLHLTPVYIPVAVDERPQGMVHFSQALQGLAYSQVTLKRKHAVFDTRASSQWGTNTPSRCHFLMYKNNLSLTMI